MASTTFKLSVPKVMEAADKEHVEDLLSKFAEDHGLQLDTQVVEPSFTYKVIKDQYASDPRKEYDHIGVMFCKHGRYTLGDKDAEDPTIKRGFVMLGGLTGYKLYLEHYDDIDDPPEGVTTYEEVEAMLHEAQVEIGMDHETSQADYDRACHALTYLQKAEVETEVEVRDDIAICAPIYLYDHSGLTVSHGSFSCPWDSGQVGWHYITNKALEENWPSAEGKLQKGEECLKSELKEYDCYLQGYVWGYEIEDEDENLVDSCWGFYGDSIEETGILGNVEDVHVEGMKEAWEKRYATG